MDLHETLIEACKKSDREAQFKLYKLYSKAMFNTSLRILKSREDAEDVMQEAFVEAFKRLDAFRYEASFGTWLKRIVINRSINALKKKKHTPLFSEEMDQAIKPAPFPDKEPRQYQLQEVYEAFHQLPEGYRVIFSLYLLEGYDHEEIAGILNISESTSRSQLLRAKNKVREYISKKREILSN